MRTVYIQRWTEDPKEDMSLVRQENDVFIDGLSGHKDCGLAVLLQMLEF